MTQAQLTVHQDGSWFRVDDQQSVDLHTRARYRVLLQMLVREHLRDPSATISVAAVIREVWPDERLRHTVARNRAYVALCSLRKWGLEGLLLRTQQGYQLDPSLRVNLVDHPPQDRPVCAGSASALHVAGREIDAGHDYATTPSEQHTSEQHASITESGFPAADPGMFERHEAPHGLRVRLMEMPEIDDERDLPRLVG